MIKLPTRLEGPILLEPDVHADERGFFLETFTVAGHRALGVATEFVQDNHSRSRQGTLRGLHYQIAPGQAKLVRAARGSIQDVVVDIRPSSPTFGQHETFELDDVRHRQLYVPIGFAHGFCVLSDIADVVYRVSSYYDGETEAGIAWDDPDLGIEWRVASPLVSERDKTLPPLRIVKASELP